MNRIISIRTYYSIRFGIVAITPVVVIIILVWLYMMPNLKNRLERERLSHAKSLMDQSMAFLQGGDRQLNALIEVVRVEDHLKKERLGFLLSSQCDVGDFFSVITMFDRKKQEFLGIGLSSRISHTKPANQTDQNIKRLKLALQGDELNEGWSYQHQSLISGEPAISLLASKHALTAYAEVPIRLLAELVNYHHQMSGFKIYITDQSGRLITTSEPQGTDLVIHLSKEELPKDRLNAVLIEINAVSMICNVLTMATGWEFIVAQEEAVVTKAVRTTFVSLIVSFLAALAFALIISWIMASRISRLFAGISEKASLIAHGEYKLKWPNPKIKEFVQLTNSLQYMARVISQREKALIASEARLEITLDSIGDAVIAANRDGVVTRMNPMAEKLTGWCFEDAVGNQLDKVFQLFNMYNDDPISSPIGSIMEKGEIVRLDEHTMLKSKDGSEYHIADSGAPIKEPDGSIVGVVLVFRDITRQTRMEEMMIQSEKMMSVGGLAAGIAHEINNPLAGMMQTAANMENRLIHTQKIPANIKAADKLGVSLESIEKYMEARDIPRMLNTIRQSGRRVAEIVNNMLSFARKSDLKASSHDLAVLVDITLELAETDYDLKKNYDFKTIEINRDYDISVPVVPCEKAKIQQVLLNILRNGAQAMQEADTPDPRFNIKTRYHSSEGMVCLEISDNGPGIDEETRKRVFEPFFTTKPVGVGTGLGLSVSYFIITENHNGEMEVRSVPGQGSTFIIRLPVDRSGQRI